MKLLRYGSNGKEHPGLLDRDGRIRDLSHHVTDIDGEVLSAGGLDGLRAVSPEELPLVPGNPRIGPCISGVSKIIGVGMNYRDHAEAVGVPEPKVPVLFMKPPSSICGPGDDIVRPHGSRHLDWEVEIGVVIGATARNVAVEQSFAHIAGYCVVNDITERGWIERSGQMLNGKSGDSFSPIGPWLVTADELPNPQDLDLFLDLNGVRRQSGNSRTMIFDIGFLVSHISTLMTLMPGDIISTGTPAGVGMRMKPPLYLEPGDVVRAGVDGLGEQIQRVIQA